MDEKTIYIDSIDYSIYKVKLHYEDRPDVRLDLSLIHISEPTRPY